MKTIDLAKTSATLTEVLRLAGEENVVLTTAEGRQFVLAEIDDFADEIARTRQNKNLMALLDGRSKDTVKLSFEQVAEELNKEGKRKPKGKDAR